MSRDPPPPFIFQVNEIREDPRSRPSTTRQGQWKPSYRRGDNVPVEGGATGLWWLCHSQGIQQLLGRDPSAAHYQTFSIYYSTPGFWIMRGDATNPSSDDTWHPLRFDYDDHDYSSYLTNAGQKDTLRCQSLNQDWASMLLPMQYQCQPSPLPRGRGGITGDLAIFLGLLALSMEPQYLTQQLPRQFWGGSWQRHGLPRGWIDRRGVVVKVHMCPPSPPWARYGASTKAELRDYENGVYGKYFE